MKLTTRSRYGALMLLDIALNSGQGPVAVKDIAKRQNISKKYLEKLIRELKKTGLLTSKRGPGGGHMLSRDPGDVTLGEIVKSLEGEDPGIVDCRKGGRECPRMEECLTRSLWRQASDFMFEGLNRITLRDLVKDARHCPRQKQEES